MAQPPKMDSLTWKQRKQQFASSLGRWLFSIEWVFERLDRTLARWAIVGVLDKLGRFSIVVAVAFWFAEASDRTRTRHYQAWGLVYAAEGNRGNGGRSIALRDLNRDHVDMTYAPLGYAQLTRLELRSARLTKADLHEAGLRCSDLTCAVLYRANLRSARAFEANLAYTDLRFATLIAGNFANTSLKSSDLCGAKLARSSLFRADFADARLKFAEGPGMDAVEADFRGASLEHANLRRARLFGARFEGASLKGADLRGALFVETEADRAAHAPTLAGPLRVATGIEQQQLEGACGDEETLSPPGLEIPVCSSRFLSVLAHRAARSKRDTRNFLRKQCGTRSSARAKNRCSQNEEPPETEVPCTLPVDGEEG